MAFTYLGRVERLDREVSEYKDRINDKYRELLGRDRFQQLGDIVERVLIPNSFSEMCSLKTHKIISPVTKKRTPRLNFLGIIPEIIKINGNNKTAI